MKRVSGLAALLGLLAAACSDSPTAPAESGTKLPAANAAMSFEAKMAWYRSMGIDLRPPAGSTTGLQSLITPPPFWNTPFGAVLPEGDDTHVFVNFGFVFNFYGRPFTGVFVNSNGNLTFDSGFDQFSSTTLPGGNGPKHPIIAVLWSDWFPPGAGTVNFKIEGLPPLRRLVVTWVGVPEFPFSGPPNTFQVQLLEFLSTIVMSYNGLSTNGFHGSTPMTAGISSGTFTGYGAGYGGLPNTLNVAVGGQVPALNGHTVCLVNLGQGYQNYSDFCSLFVH